jgi:hypothetical protein
MDDLAHTLRKRKSRQDDHDGNKSKTGRQNCDKDLAGRPAKAPRLSWLSSDTNPALWNAPPSPQVATPVTSPSTFSPVFPLKCSQHNSQHLPVLEPSSSPSSPTSLTHSDTATDGESEDVNLPLCKEQPPRLPLGPDEALSIPAATLNIATLQLPPLIPSINRQTLKDLDFNQIMHNTPLRASLTWPFHLVVLNVSSVHRTRHFVRLRPAIQTRRSSSEKGKRGAILGYSRPRDRVRLHLHLL